MTDCWNPAQYEKFRTEREQPFFDLLRLVQPEPAMRVVDLGCGTGKQTRILHERLAAASTVGLDRSPRMLESAPADVPGLSFRQATIEELAHDGRAKLSAERSFDLVFSNAALHWVDRHSDLIPRLARLVNAGGQLAFQVPASHDDLSHRVAEELARIEPFRSAFGGWRRPQPVLAPSEYARLLFDSGFSDQHVALTVYPHVLDRAEDVVEWMTGTLLTEYQRHLPEPLREKFVEAYRAAVVARVANTQPFFFPFQRILCWGRRRP